MKPVTRSSRPAPRPVGLLARECLLLGRALVALTATVTAAAAAAEPSGPSAAVLSAKPDPGMPFVYTKWEQFTSREGLPNDHVFAVKADAGRGCVWIGTEDGLARYDKATGQITSWREKDGLPWRVVTAIEVDARTGDLWLGLFGGGLARFSAGRFDHFHQLNSGLVNDVVYAIATEGDHVWCATTAGASRYNTKTDKWDIFTEKNAPMEEIWNYNVCANDGKVHLAVWGSGVLEYDVKTENWKAYLDPDGEMEIDLYRDDGNVHVITTGASYVEKVLWISSYFGCARYDGRHWRGYFDHDCGLPSNFNNNLKARTAQECWFASDKGAGACVDAESDTWVTYTSDGKQHTGTAVVKRGRELLRTVDTGYSVPHNFIISIDFDGPDVWVGTSKGLGRGVGEGYYPRLRVPPGSGSGK
jgi:ligand-binding sensor domain-containing protein